MQRSSESLSNGACLTLQLSVFVHMQLPIYFPGHAQRSTRSRAWTLQRSGISAQNRKTQVIAGAFLVVAEKPALACGSLLHAA